jgi:hypothetical protein
MLLRPRKGGNLVLRGAPEWDERDVPDRRDGRLGTPLVTICLHGVATHSGVGGYRGHDRRDRTRSEAQTAPLADVVREAAIVAVAALLPAVFALVRGASPEATGQLIGILAGLLAVGAGATALVSWKISGLAVHGWVGVAFVDLGLLGLATTGLPVLGAGSTLPIVEAVDRLAVMGLVAVFVLLSLATPEVDARLSPVELLAASGMGGLGAVGGVALLVGHFLPQGSSAVVWPEGFDGLAALTLGIVALVLYGSRGTRPALARTLPAVFAILAVGELLRAGLHSATGAAVPALDAVALFAAALAFSGLLGGLRFDLSVQDRYSLSPASGPR